MVNLKRPNFHFADTENSRHLVFWVLLSSFKSLKVSSKTAVLHASVRGSKGSGWLLKYCGPDVIWQMKAQRTTGSLLVQPYQTVLLHTSFQLQAASSNETHGEESRPMKQHEDM